MMMNTPTVNGLACLFKTLLLGGSQSQSALEEMDHVELVKKYDKLLLLLLPKPTCDGIDVKEYFDSISLQLLHLLTNNNIEYSNLQSAAAHVIVGFLAKRPILSTKLLLNPLLAPIEQLYLTSTVPPLAKEKDLEGNWIVISEKELENAIIGIKLLLVGNEPLPALIDRLQNRKSFMITGLTFL